MTREEIISGLKFTVDMFLFDPFTGESFTEPRNDMDKTTIDACRGAIELLEQEPCEYCISRKAVLNTLEFCDKVLDVDRTVESYKSLLVECYKMLSSIQPKPKTGHWIAVENEEMETIGYYCSKCDLPMETEEQTDYCPNCGAKMAESENKSGKEQDNGNDW